MTVRLEVRAKSDADVGEVADAVQRSAEVFWGLAETGNQFDVIFLWDCLASCVKCF